MMIEHRLQKIILAIAIVLAMCGSAAIADSVTVDKIPYDGCSVKAVTGDLSLEFEMKGQVIRKPLADITRIKIDSNSSFTKAEDAMSTPKGDPKEAIKAYDSAGSEPPLDKLVPLRRIRAANAAGDIRASTRDWLAIMEFTGASKAAMAMKPAKLAAKGSSENDAAIALLEDKLTRLEGKPQYATAVKRVLLGLYQRQGMNSQAAKLAGELAGNVAKPGDDTIANETTRQPAPTPSGEELGAQLDAMAAMLKSGKAAQALAGIEANLRKYTPADLPQALLLMGKAQMALKDQAKGEARRQLLVEAGLNFMRVVAFFGATEEAPESLYLAGVVNEELGNKASAEMAYDRLLRTFPKCEFVERARQRKDKLAGKQ